METFIKTGEKVTNPQERTQECNNKLSTYQPSFHIQKNSGELNVLFIV